MGTRKKQTQGKNSRIVCAPNSHPPSQSKTSYNNPSTMADVYSYLHIHSMKNKTK